MSNNWLIFLVVGIVVEAARNAYFSSQTQFTSKYCLHHDFTLHGVSLLLCAVSCVMRAGCRVVAYKPTTRTCMGCQYAMDFNYSQNGYDDNYDVPVEIPAESILYSPDSSSYVYIGCYADCMIHFVQTSPCLGRALPQISPPDLTLTTDECFEICKRCGSRFFGTQSYYNCGCGLVYDKFGVADRCDSNCGGNASQTCGGYYANSVYEILLRD